MYTSSRKTNEKKITKRLAAKKKTKFEALRHYKVAGELRGG